MNKYVCRMCPSYYCDTFKRYFRHLKYCHEMTGNLNVTRNIDGCMQNFSILNSDFKHITRKHPDFHRENFGRNTETIVMNDNDLPNNDETLPDTEALDEDLCTDIDYENIVAMFLLELREMKKVSGVACSFVATSVINLIKLALHTKVQSVLLKMDKLQINNPDLHENVLADEINLINALTKFSLIKNLDNYIRQKSTFVPPVEIVLN